MKKEIVEFACDSCRKKIKVVASSNHHVVYPYSSGWIYIFDIAYKTDHKQKSLRDKHFCSRKCLVKFVGEKAI